MRVRQGNVSTDSERARWMRLSWWAQLGGVLAALAAVGGIIFTGIATYYGAVVAEDQLAQSKEDAENKARRQASKVAFYEVGEPSSEERRLNIVNRSPDPTTDTSLVVRLRAKEGDPDPQAVYLITRIGTLPPCSTTAIDVTTLKRQSGVDKEYPRRFWYGPGAMRLFFSDAQGVEWERTEEKLEINQDREVRYGNPGENSVTFWSQWKDALKVEPARPCTDL